MLLSTPSSAKERGWSREITVPWKDSFAIVELELWSIFSMAAVVNTLPLIVGGLTTCSLWNCWQTLFPIWVESWRRSYDMLTPWCNSLSMCPLAYVSMHHHPYICWNWCLLCNVLPDADRWRATCLLVLDAVELQYLGNCKCCSGWVCHLVFDSGSL